jgi:hypothetical protein
MATPGKFFRGSFLFVLSGNAGLEFTSRLNRGASPPGPGSAAPPPRAAPTQRSSNANCQITNSAFAAELARIPITRYSDLNSGEFSYDL